MPIYKLRCVECGRVFEKLVFKVDNLPPCPCGGKTERLPTMAAFKFKGPGFHRTDYPNIDQLVGEQAEKGWEARIERWKEKKKLMDSCSQEETVVMREDFTYEKVKKTEVPQAPPGLFSKEESTKAT